MFSVWPPLAIEIDMWAEGGISDARVNVMKRVRALNIYFGALE